MKIKIQAVIILLLALLMPGLHFRALREIRKKRPFIISRSSYPGHGHFTGIWTGDVWSTWDDMAHSVSGLAVQNSFTHFLNV